MSRPTESRRRRYWRWLLAALLAGVLGWLTLGPHALALLWGVALGRGAAAAGWELTWGDLAAERVGRLRLDDLRLSGPSGIELELAEFELDYHLGGLLGDSPLEALDRLAGRRGRLRVRPRTDPGVNGDGERLALDLTHLPALDLQDLDLDLELDGRAQVRARRISLTTPPDGPGAGLALAAERIDLALPARHPLVVPRVALDGRLMPHGAELSALRLGAEARELTGVWSGLGGGPALELRWPTAGGELTASWVDGAAGPELRANWSTAQPGRDLERELRLWRSVEGLPVEVAASLGRWFGLEGSLAVDLELGLDPDTDDWTLEASSEGRRLAHPTWGMRPLEAALSVARDRDGWRLWETVLAIDGQRLEVIDARVGPEDSQRSLLARSDLEARITVAAPSDLWSVLGAQQLNQVGPLLAEVELWTDPQRERVAFGARRLDFEGIELNRLEGWLAPSSGSAPLDAALAASLDCADLSALLARFAGGALSGGESPAMPPDLSTGGRARLELEALWRERLPEWSIELGVDGLALNDRPCLEAFQATARGAGLPPERIESELHARSDAGDRFEARGALLLPGGQLAEGRWTQTHFQLAAQDLSRWQASAPSFELDLDGELRGAASSPTVAALARWRSRAESLGEGRADLRWEAGALRVHELTHSAGDARIDAAASVVPPTADGDWALHLDRFELAAGAQAEAETLLALQSPVRVDAELLQGPAAPWSAAFAGPLGSLRLSRSQRAWRAVAFGIDLARAPLPPMLPGLQFGPLDGWAELEDALDPPRLAAELELTRPRWSSPSAAPSSSGELALERVTLTLDLSADALSAPMPIGRLELLGEGLRTRSIWPDEHLAPDGKLALSLTGDAAGGRVELAEVELPGRLRLEGTGGWLPGPDGRPRLDIALAGELSDLSALDRMTDQVRTSRGRLDLQRLVLRGDPTSPELEAQARLDLELLRLGPGLPALRDVRGDFAIDGHGVCAVSLSASSGSAPIALEGQIPLRGEDGLELRLSGANALLWRSSDLSLRGDVDLTLGGTLARPSLGGTVELANSRFERTLELAGFGGLEPRPTRRTRGVPLFSMREGALASLEFDVELTSREQDPLRIVTNVLEMTVRPELHLGGTGRRPELEGSVFTDPARLRLPATSLRLARGVVRFTSDRPGVPWLDLRGETRMRGYDLTLEARGPYDDPEVTVQTVPPLSTEDALVLLATGQPPESAFTRGGGIQTAETLALYLARDLGTELFAASGETDESLLERFEAEVGRDISRTGRPTLELRFRLVDAVFGPNDSLFLTAERDRYEDVNGGVRFLVRFD
jgi:hypothetical protein